VPRVDDAMCLTYHFAHHRNAIGARLGDSIEHRQPLLAIVPAPDAVILIRTIPTCTPLRDLGRGYGAVTSLPVLGGLHHQYCRI
jgi:hypothetical protein